MSLNSHGIKLFAVFNVSKVTSTHIWCSPLWISYPRVAEKAKGGHSSEHVWEPFRLLHARVSCFLSEGDNWYSHWSLYQRVINVHQPTQLLRFQTSCSDTVQVSRWRWLPCKVVKCEQEKKSGSWGSNITW